MATSDFIDWAERQWGQVQLGDKRRNPRAVQLGAALAARNYSGSSESGQKYLACEYRP